MAIEGVDVFKPQTGEVVSEGKDGIALWMIDTDYNEESFFVRHAYFLGANDPYKALKTTLKAEIDAAVKDANKAVSQAEAIKKFAILGSDFTEDNGMLTPSLKLKRSVVMKEFGDEVEGLYAR